MPKVASKVPVVASKELKVASKVLEVVDLSAIVPPFKELDP